MTDTLKGKLAVVTGASAGIGHATAVELAALGAAVVVHARRKERLDTLVNGITAAGGRALAVAGDAGNVADNARLIDEAMRFSQSAAGGTLDIVVVNAGRGLAGGLLSSDVKQWEELYRTNVLGAADLMRRAAEKMQPAKGGQIVVVSSVVGSRISPFSGFYGSTKFAIAALAETLRREVAGKGLRVSTILPGVVKSEFQEKAGYTPENFFKGIERFGELLVPEDVARAIGFVVSQPPHVNISELMVRPSGQDYP